MVTFSTTHNFWLQLQARTVSSAASFLMYSDRKIELLFRMIQHPAMLPQPIKQAAGKIV